MAIYFAPLPSPLSGWFSPPRIPQFDPQKHHSGLSKMLAFF
uniref:Uncharacterized protein n=1 Tax=Arundo donax TaxID=35708 RepID=A0A0A9A8J8_ARUDO